MKTAFSYVRLSSKKQIKGTGAERQLEKPQAIADANAWELSKRTFSDLGVSAFKGDNRLKGDLSIFIQLYKSGKLPKESVLIIEAFDRWSRQDIDESEPALLELLKLGCDIHIAFGNKTFTKDSTKKLGDRIEILISLKAAFDYSENLSKRIKSQRKIKEDRMRNGSIEKHHNVPAYYTFNKDKTQFDQNEVSLVAKRIIEDYLNGESLYGISKRLNSDRIPSFRAKTQDNWSREGIKCVLTSKTLYGEFLGIPNYFSKPIIDKNRFDKIQLMLIKNSGNRGRYSTDYINLFKGLTKCSGCDGTMCLGVQLKNSKSGKFKKEPYRYLRCSSVSNSMPCENKHNMNLIDIEDEFFGVFLQQDPKKLIGKKMDAKTDNRITTIQLRMKEISEQLSQLFLVKYQSPELDAASTKLNTERETLKKELEKLTLLKNESESSVEVFSDFKKLYVGLRNEERAAIKGFENAIDTMRAALKNPELRVKIRNMLPSMFSKIVFNSKEGTWQVFDLNQKMIYQSMP
ncbi:MAG: recombinase family protein [Limisphaerales bacterium]